MGRLRLMAIGLVIGGFLVMTSAASAVTLGTTDVSQGAPQGCVANSLNTEIATDSSFDYAVPAGGGQITSWSTYVVGATPGAPVTLVVLQPSSGNQYTVVGFDDETVPASLPPSGVATFTVANSITAPAGDLIGLFSSSSSVTCGFFSSSNIPAAEMSAFGFIGSHPTTGTTYGVPMTSNNSLVNVSANLAQPEDATVSGTASPASIVAGGAAEYAFTVGNGGPGNGPITFTDTVPTGLKVLSAAAGSGTCSTSGQSVTCTIAGLAPGATVPVLIIVSAASAGSYPDSATVAPTPPFTDPNAANNSASATLTVTPAPVAQAPAPPSCKVVSLAGAPLTVAKAVISALNCSVGKTTTKASKTVRKGYVISTSPGSGRTLANGTKVNIVVSSGPPKKKKAKKKK